MTSYDNNYRTPVLVRRSRCGTSTRSTFPHLRQWSSHLRPITDDAGQVAHHGVESPVHLYKRAIEQIDQSARSTDGCRKSTAQGAEPVFSGSQGKTDQLAEQQGPGQLLITAL